MSIRDCYADVVKIMQSMEDKVSRSEMREIAKKLVAMQEQGLDPKLFAAKALEIHADKIALNAERTRSLRLQNLMFADRAKLVLNQDIPKMNMGQKFLAYIQGNSRRLANAMNLSVEGLRAGHMVGWLRDLNSVLSREDIKVVETGDLNRHITQELDAFQRGTEVGLSGSPMATRIAKAYHSVQAASFAVKQAFNPFLEKIQDYYYRASHDRQKISAVPKQDWVTFTESKYGEKSFPEMDAAERLEALGEIYDQIKSGTYESMLDFTADPGNIVARQARKRTLIPNDWQSFHEYNEAFGRRNIHDSMVRSLETAAHDIAVMQKFGATPGDVLKQMRADVAKSGDPAAITSVESMERSIQDAFDAMTEFSRAPATSTKARVVRGSMAIVNIARNNAWVLRSLPDIANIALKASDLNGKSVISNFVDAGVIYAKHFASNRAELLRASQDALLFSRTALYSMYSEMGGVHAIGNRVEQTIAKGLELQSKLTLGERHILAIESGMAALLSRDLGQATNHVFADLHIRTQAQLRNYGILAPEWELIRQGVESWEGTHTADVGDLSRMVSVDSLRAIPDEAIGKYLRETGVWKGDSNPSARVILRARTELQGKMGALVNDYARQASSTASAADRLWLYGRHDPDSKLALTRQMIGQFKSAIVANYNTMVRSHYSNPLKPQGDFSKSATHVVLASGLYLFGAAVKDTASGKTPSLTGERMGEALLESGALGMVGMSVLGEAFHSDRSAAETAGSLALSLAGPIPTLALESVGIGAKALRAPFSDLTDFPSKDVGKLISSILPYQNLFYTKAAYNYYLNAALMDFFAPGYMGGQVRRMNQQGQDYWIYNPAKRGVFGTE